MGASSEEASTSEVEPEPPRDTSEDCWIDCSPNGDRGVLRRIIKPGNTASGHPIDGWCAKVNYDAYIFLQNYAIRKKNLIVDACIEM